MRDSISHTLKGHVLLLAVLVALFSGWSHRVRAQGSPYELSWGKGLVVGGIGLASLGGGLYFESRYLPLTEEEIAALDPVSVMHFDRFATRQTSKTAKIISDVTGYGATVLPLSLIASPRVREHGGDPSLLYAQGLLLNTGITQLVKNTVRRPRPYTFNPNVPLSRKQVKDARRSFFSGHTSNAAFNSFFTAQVYEDFYPRRRGDGWVWVSAALLPAITGSTRVLSGNHYWSDVLVGYLVGAGIGVLVPTLAKL